MTHIYVGFIGSGEIAEFHARALSNIDDVTIAGAFDLDSKTAQSFGEKFNVRVYAELSDLLSDNSIHAAYVLTRHDSHADLISKSLGAGKHVFSEKPLALNLGTAEKIRDDVHKSEKFLMLGFNQRWTPTINWIKDKKQTTHTKILSLSLTFSTSPFLESWAGLAREGGGVFPCLGSHALDLACHLIGEHPSHLAAFSSRQKLVDPYLDDTASVIFSMPNGALVNINFQDHAAKSYVNYGTGDPSYLLRAEIFTNQWTATIESSHEIILFQDNHQERIIMTIKNPMEVMGIQQENEHFIHCLKSDTMPYPDVEDGIRATQLVQLAEEASKSHMIKAISPRWVNKNGAHHQ